VLLLLSKSQARKYHQVGFQYDCQLFFTPDLTTEEWRAGAALQPNTEKKAVKKPP
jgi:hypothetical protein